MTRSRTRQASAIIIAAAALAVLLTTVGSATANPSIRSKRAQAQAVLAQIQQQDAQLEKAIESYNYANVQLQQIDVDLNSNARHLVVARKSLGVAQQHIAERLKALYVNGDGGGAVEILLGAQSLDDLLNRLDVVQRVGSQDAKVLGDVKQFRKEVKPAADAAEGRPGQAGAGGRRPCEPEAVDRGPAGGAEADARRHPDRDQAAAGRGGGAAGAAAPGGGGAAPRAAAPAGVSPGAGRRARRERLLLGDRQRLHATHRSPPPRPRSTVASSGSRCSTSATPYVWGGSSPGGFDCSGFVAYVYAQMGVSLPHNAASQYGYGTPVAYSDLEPGDLVFFSGLGHVGIYIGGGQFIHAPHTGDVVKISSLSEHGGYVGARRL